VRQAPFALLVATATAALFVSVAQARTPQQLYTRLLSTAFADSELPSGFFSAKVSLTNPSSAAKKRHVVGEVEVDIDGPDAADAIVFYVFPNKADALDDLNNPQSPSGTKEHVMGRVPGYGANSQWIVGSVTGNNAFGKKVTNGITGLFALKRNVLVGAVTLSADNPDSGNMPGALALLRSALKHLAKVQSAK
jgi:hypothetical protein